MRETAKGNGRARKTQGGDAVEQKKLEIDARSHLLITEFYEHLNQMRAAGDADPRVVFEAWAIQKIAGLQVLLLERAGRVA